MREAVFRVFAVQPHVSCSMYIHGSERPILQLDKVRGFLTNHLLSIKDKTF